MDSHSTDGWAVEQLTAFLYVLAHADGAEGVVREAIDRAAESLEAEIAVLVVSGSVVASVGFPRGKVPEGELLDVATNGQSVAVLPGVGHCHILGAFFEPSDEGCLLVARTGGEGFSVDERNLLRGMSRALALNLQASQVLAAERALRARSDEQAAENALLLAALQDRQALTERLTRIQQSISGQAPLPDVLRAIVCGAAELIGDRIVALRRIDATDPAYAVVQSATESPYNSVVGARIKVGQGAGGRAIAEGRLVVVHDYAHAEGALTKFAAAGVRAAMSAPVRENGVVVGSLVVASDVPGRRYSDAEQEILLSFADHASLALTDAAIAESLRRALRDARHDAMHDELTQLPNRTLLRDRLDQAWARGRRSGSPIALLFLDFDDFKNINDSLGHDAGDHLLVTIAGRLAEALRPGDTIARLGGDEFAVLIEDFDAANSANDVATRLLHVVAQPVELNGREVTISGSIGIAISDYAQRDSQSLLYSADLAMYEAKHIGGGRFVRYVPDMHQHTLERLDTEQTLKLGIASGQLLLHYQPIHDLHTRRIVGFEALVRWEHPTRGLLGPGEFVPVAESSRLITSLGEWVLRAACQQAATWPSDLEMAVNLSPRQVEAGLPGLVREVLHESGLSPDRLTLEVTEGTAMADDEETQHVLEELHEIGVRFAIDDFGTGHSSLSRLRSLPVNQLKIDMSFISDLDEDPGNAVLISAIIALSHGSGLVAVAEGLETEEQLRILTELGCDRAQGYLLGRPVDAVSASLLLSSSAGNRLSSSAR